MGSWTKGMLLVEGHGEVEAAGNLVARVTAELWLPITWTPPRRWTGLHRWEARKGGVRKGAEFARIRPGIGALLILRDEDDGCPAHLADRAARKERPDGLRGAT